MTTITYLVLFLAPPHVVCCGAPKEEQMKVTVLVILGHDKDTEVNAKLEKIAPELRKKDMKLTGFELKKTVVQSMGMGETKQIDLAGSAKLTLTVNEKTDNDGRATVTIKPPKLDDITYACTCGKYFPILTNYYVDDKRLIIAISVEPCKKK
jgi:hypothetical protein